MRHLILAFKIFFFVFISCQLSAQSYLTYWNKGNSVVSLDFAAGLKYYQKAAEIAHNQGEYVWEANILADQGGAHYDLGQYEDAIKACKRGLELVQNLKVKNDSVNFKLLSSLAPSYRKLYKSALAIQTCEKAAQILDLHPEVLKQTPLFAAYFYRNYGELMQDLFDTEKARIYYLKGLEVSRILPNPIHHARLLGNLSNLYAFTSEYQKGIELYLQLIKILNTQKKRNFLELAKSHYMLGYFYSKVSAHEMAVLHYTKAINLGRKFKDNFDYPGMSSIDLCENYLKMGKVDLARKILEKIPHKNGNLEYEYYLNLAWANVSKASGEFVLSKEFYERALRVYYPTFNPENIDPDKSSIERLKLFEVLNHLGNLYRHEYTTRGSKIALRKGYLMKSKCLQVGRQIRKYQDNLDSRLFFTDKYHVIFKDLLDMGLEMNKLSKQNVNFQYQLFEMAEEAKSVMLNDPLKLKNNQRDAVSDSLILKLQSYQSYLSYLKSGNANQIEILEYEQNVNSLRDKITFRKSEIKRVKVESEFVLRELPEDVIYLNYFLFNNSLMIFAKSSKSLIMRKIPLDNLSFLKNVDLLRKALITPPSPFEGYAGDEYATIIHDILLEKSIPEIKNFTRLVVNPDNKFFDISFDILRNRKSGLYLIETHSVSYAPSIDRAMIRKAPNRWFQSDWIAFFPFSDISKQLISGLKPLRFSIKDVKGVKTKNYKDSSASKFLFLKSLEQNSHQAVLISTHASSNSDDPYLLFNASNRPDSRLFASELKHYQIETPMVVLSACDTHKGKTYEGLGAMSFATSIVWAGCPSVAATFWEVDDQSMSVLTSLFYKHLHKGLSKDLALQKAKIEYLQTSVGKANDLPFYWSHFQVIGSIEPIISSTQFCFPYFLVATLLIVVFVIFRKRIVLFFKP